MWLVTQSLLQSSREIPTYILPCTSSSPTCTWRMCTDVSELADTEKNYPSYSVPCSNVFLCDFWYYRQFPLGCNGHWPVCCHLPSTSLHHNHEPQALLLASDGILGSVTSSLTHSWAAFLSVETMSSTTSFVMFNHCWHSPALIPPSMSFWPSQMTLLWSWALLSLLSSLISVSLGQFWRSLSRRKVQSIVYLWVPPHCCGTILWNYNICVH